MPLTQRYGEMYPKYQQIQTIKYLTVQRFRHQRSISSHYVTKHLAEIQASRAIVTTLAPAAVDARRAMF